MPLRALPVFALCLALAAPARGAPVEDGSRVALAAGWRYVPNGRFAELAAAAGHPLDHASQGGPAVMATFAYRPTLELELGLEVGYARETFAFRDAPMDLTTVPLAVALRYAFLRGPFTAWLGGGMSYFLNFVGSGPVGSLESHGAGPVVLAGASLDVGERVALLAEYRLGFSRVSVPGLAPLQTGGNWLLLGVQLSFPPEEKRLP